MCFYVESRPGHTKTRARTLRPLRTTAPAHNTPRLKSEMYEKKPSTLNAKKNSNKKRFETYVFFHGKSRGVANRR